MPRNISDVCKDCYQKHRIGSSIIYTDMYGKTVIEEESFATVVYNHDNSLADIYCNSCGEYLGYANCMVNSFWSYVHDVVNVHQCVNKDREKR